MNFEPLKNYSHADWPFLETELTKPELFLETETKLITDAQIFSYWKYITNNTNTEIILEDKYIKSWCEWALGDHDIQTARIASKLSKFLLFAIGARPFSEMLMGIAARIAESLLGADTAETAQYINDHGFFMDEFGNKRKAKSLYLKAYKIRQNILEADDPAIAESLNNLATLETEKKALPKLRLALEIRKKSLGVGHPDTLNSMRNVASTLDLIGKHEEAKSLLLESIKICKEIHGDSSDESSDSLTYYSIYLWHNGQTTDAQLYALRSLEIKEKNFGINNPELLINLISISEAYFLNNQPQEALSYLNRGLDISLNFNGPDHCTTNDIRDRISSIEKLDEVNICSEERLKRSPSTVH